MNVVIENEYGYSDDYSYLNEVIEKALEMEEASDAVFSIIFVSNERIQELNKNYRNKDSVTDVISFAFEDNGIVNQDIRFLGEIYICIPRMLIQAEEYGHSVKRELSFLTVHGILHLLGYDHQTKDEENIMFKRQELILDATNIKR